MYQNFNCGIGIDVVGADCAEFKEALGLISHATGVKLFHLGVCGETTDKKNRVALQTPFGNFNDY